MKALILAYEVRAYTHMRERHPELHGISLTHPCLSGPYQLWVSDSTGRPHYALTRDIHLYALPEVSFEAMRRSPDLDVALGLVADGALLRSCDAG
jgi:hypothetical protein